jgi:hypothetical protein
MKRSRKVEIALVAGLAMSGCGRRDPCAPQTFNQDACLDAINHNGYYYGGHWYPHSYSGGFSAYYNGYYSYVGNGGNVTPISPSEWSVPSGASASGPPGATSAGSESVSRGVFGSSFGSSGGEGHGSGGGE